MEFDSNNEFQILYKEVIDLNYLNQKLGLSSDDKHQKKQNNKRKFETIEICKYIFNKATHFKCQNIAIEELNISPKDNQMGKNFNRLCNNIWQRNLIQDNLQKRCNIYGLNLIEINPAYSSFVGNVQYGNENTPDMVASATEIGRRSYRKYEKNWFYPVKKNIENLRNLWKEELDFSSIHWKELFSYFKKSKLKYRFPLDSKMASKVFSFNSLKSYISLYHFR